MPSLEDSLSLIEAALRRLDHSAIAFLRPGLAQGEASARLHEHALPAPGELCSLYAWHDGTDTTTDATLGELWLFPGFYLSSLDQALANYRAFRHDRRWNPAWLPVLADGGGDLLVLDTAGHPASCPVRHFRIEESEHPVEYPSIRDMAATFAAAYERGLVLRNSDGWLDLDDSAYAVVAAELNPSVRWWRE